MKKFVLIALSTLVLGSCASNTSFNSFYQDHRQDAAITVSTPSFVANMLIPKEDVAEYKKLFKKVRHYKVMIFNGNDGSLDKSFHKFIRKNKYNEVFKVQNNGNKVSFYFLKWDNYIHEMVMKVAEEDSYILLGLKTKILESELHEIIASAEVELTAL